MIDGGAGLPVGYPRVPMLLGIDPVRFAVQVASPIVSLLPGRAEPNAVLVTRGLNAGIQAGGSVTGTIGYLAQRLAAPDNSNRPLMGASGIP